MKTYLEEWMKHRKLTSESLSQKSGIAQKMIDELGLNKPIYSKTACYGHFGRDFPWEKIIKLVM